MYNVYEEGQIYPKYSYHTKEKAEKMASALPHSYVMFEPEEEDDFVDFDLDELKGLSEENHFKHFSQLGTEYEEY